MAESGIDISLQKSKPVGELIGIAFDLVVTVCDSAAESCPVFPGRAERLHRSFEDPPRLALSAKSEEEAMNHYRRVRDQIRDYVAELVDRYRPQG
jgi:arsenate reductase